MGQHGWERTSLTDINTTPLSKVVVIPAGTKEWALQHWMSGHDVQSGDHTNPQLDEAPADGWRVTRLMRG